MGLIQNKVKVSQPNSHVVVKNAGGLRGLTGETGPQGPQGVPGEAATVTAGTTTTLPAGSDATVQNVGSTSAAIFNFGIPKGDKGDTGESGAAATISVGTTTTLEPGEDATVTNSGTSSAAVFDFGIPKGAKGDTGSQGPAGQDGADGFSPTATVTKTGDTATITITDKDGTTTAQISDGVTPTIDSALSPTSENPVQNKVVTNALAGKADKPIVVSSLPATGTAGQEYFVDDRYNTVTELKGDTQQQTYSGKNLLLPSPRTQGSSGLTASYDSDTGIITLSGTANNNWSNTFDDMPVSLAAGTYTFSATTEAGLGRNIIFFNGTTNILQKTLSATATSVECVVPQNATSVRLWLSPTNGTNYTGKTFKAQLESGSQATSFEPYVGGTASPNPDYPQEVQTVTGRQLVTISDGGSQSQEYEINLGKNLFDLGANLDNYFVTVSTGTKVYTDNDKSFVTATFSNNKVTFTDYVTTNWRWVSKVVPLEKNTTYTISGDWTSSLRIVGFDSLASGANGTLIKQINPDAGQYPPATFDSGSYNYVVISLFPGTDSKYFDSIQIEKGSTATTYAPYFTPTELCKIGDYQDYIYKSGEDWYVRKNIGNAVFDGSEAWGVASTNPNMYYLANAVSPAVVEYPSGYSNYFTVVTRYPNQHLGELAIRGANKTDLMIRYDSMADVTALTTWLGTHNTSLYYPLATATDIQITNAALIAQLEALAGAKIMVDGGTATVTSQYLPATLATVFNSNSGYIDYIYDGTNFVKVR